jgi:hypothetical protein
VTTEHDFSKSRGRKLVKKADKRLDYAP